MPIQHKPFSFLWSASWRMLWRDWRAGELNILTVGLIIAVTSITAVGFFTDRIERGMQQQSAELIGADLVITSARANVIDHIEDARARQFQVALVQQFRSVIVGNDRAQLVEVKAVTESYPLRGMLRISDTAFGSDQATTAIPEPGNLWVEARLLQILGMEPGGQVSLGEKTFTLKKILRHEPDRGGDLFSIAPRVLMNRADVDATGLTGTGALVSWRVLISGPPDLIENYKTLLSAQLRQGENILTVEEGRPELNQALQRAQQYLGLAALISVLLAGVAIATVAHRFTSRHLDTSAMLRCLGATQRTIIRLFLLEMFWLSFIASTAGCALGLFSQFVITEILGQLMLSQLPAPSLNALLMGYATGIILLIGFALPPLLSLQRVPPLRVMRKDVIPQRISGWIIYVTVVLSMGVLLFWQIGDLKLVATVLGGMAATIVILAASAYILILGLNRLRGQVGVAWRFGLANISRRPASSMIQVVAFGIGIMVMLLLTTVRTDLLNQWQRSLPEEAPNHFIINVQTDQVEAIQDYFNQLGVENTRIYPMVRARLVEINGRPARTSDYESERARHMLTREFNLSWSGTMQTDNEVTAGEWWSSEDYGKPLLSLEQKLANRLRLNVGDVVGFDINGTVVDFTITNLRSVDWDTFNINFFTVVPPQVLEDQPANWVTSIYLDREQRQQLTQLVRQFPNVTIVDIDAIMQRIRDLIERVSLAIEFIFIFTILAGLAVLYAAIQANQDERRFENAILRTLGARRKILLLGLIAEFSVLGALSGLLAGISATTLALLLAEFIFKFDYQFDLSVAFTGIVSGIIIVVIAGLLGTRSVLTHPPIESLRRGAA